MSASSAVCPSCSSSPAPLPDPIVQVILDQLASPPVTQSQLDEVIDDLHEAAESQDDGRTHVIQQILWRLWRTTDNSAVALNLLSVLYGLKYEPYEINRALVQFACTCDTTLKEALHIVLSNVACPI